MNPPRNRLLVATVGGSIEPIVASVLHWRPQRAIFVVSKESYATVGEIDTEVQARDYADFKGRSESYPVNDHQDILKTCEELKHLFDDQISGRVPDAWEIVVDITGGTKAMSAALAITADRFGSCRFSYIGGSDRTKGGLGEVISGSEEVIARENPSEALGLRLVAEAEALMRRHAFATAAALLRVALSALEDKAHSDRLNAVAILAEALSYWDRFKHKEALAKLEEVRRKRYLVESTFGYQKAQRILRGTEDLAEHCKKILGGLSNGQARPTRWLILDLLANAKRRYFEERWDDAVARLYRTIEAIAQLRLTDRGYSDTGAIDVASLPEAMRAKFASCTENGCVMLGLQDAWELLAATGDTAASVFKEQFGNSQRSPLVARNHSILAHGFIPVSRETARHLLDAACVLLEVERVDMVFEWPSD